MRKVGKKIICFSGVLGMLIFLFVLLGIEFSHSEGGKLFVSLVGRSSIIIFPLVFFIGLTLYVFGKKE